MYSKVKSTVFLFLLCAIVGQITFAQDLSNKIKITYKKKVIEQTTEFETGELELTIINTSDEILDNVKITISESILPSQVMISNGLQPGEVYISCLHYRIDEQTHGESLNIILECTENSVSKPFIITATETF